MNAKIERISKEIEKIKGKIDEWQSKVQELEKQKTEMENAEIVEAVRGTNVSLADLAAILKKVSTEALNQFDLNPESTATNKEEI